MGKSLRLGRVFGIPVEINITWVIIFLLLTYLLAGRFDSFYPPWPVYQQWIVAIISVGLFFLSVLAHELSHSLVAQSRGIPVAGITLFIFGGVSHLSREPSRPSEEFLISIVGPLTSIALAVAAGGIYIWLNSSAYFWPTRFASPFEMVAFLLAWANLSVGVFNMIPGFPLDGGRVLRAAVWAGSGSHLRGTRVATRCGQAVGLLMMVGGVLYIVLWDNWIDGIWAAVIGFFLLSVATSSYPKSGQE